MSNIQAPQAELVVVKFPIVVGFSRGDVEKQGWTSLRAELVRSIQAAFAERFDVEVAQQMAAKDWTLNAPHITTPIMETIQ